MDERGSSTGTSSVRTVAPPLTRPPAPSLDETTGPSTGTPLPLAPDPAQADLHETRVSAAAPWDPTPRPRPKLDLPRIGRFVVLRELGQGAMGVVYAGYDEELDRKVALKLLRSDGSANASIGRNQLLREAQALARLSHPNVVAVHEAGVHPTGPHEAAVFIAMEYVQGVDLQRWLAAAPRHWREVIGAFRQAGEGLLAAHRRGLVHRDFKPSNVLVGDDGRVRVADFGLAARRDASDPTPRDQSNTLAGIVTSSQPLSETLAGEGALIGTPAYMAPEQLRREPATAYSDQFAFCVALWEALYGARPFAGDSVEALLHAVERAPPPALPQRPDVPRWLHPVLLRGFAVEPTMRWPSLAELLAELARDPEAERARRRKWIFQTIAAVGLTVLAVALAAQVVAALRRYSAEQRAEARLETLRGQLAELHAQGQDREAERLLRAFLELPDNRGTSAVSAAGREWAELQSDHAAAADAYASAYIAARDPDEEVAALRGLVRRLAARGSFAEAAAALSTLDARAPALRGDPELAGPRLATALHRRDLAAARDALARLPASDPARTYDPALEHMSRATVLDVAALDHDSGLHEPMLLGDLDGDARPEIVTTAPRRGEDLVVVRRADASLGALREVRVPAPLRALQPLDHAFAGAPRLLTATPNDAPEAQFRHHVLDLEGRPLYTWADSSGSALTVDLDGDGAQELYFGSQAYTRRLSRLTLGADGAWQRRQAHPPTDALRSDYYGLAAADLDGDGRLELAAAVGPWSAYDLRVFRAGDDGELELVARRSFGYLHSLTPVPGDGAQRLAFVKQDGYPNPERFGPERPHGDPAGIYVVALAGDALEVVQHVPAAPANAPPRPFGSLHSGDVDGDGAPDLVAGGHDALSLLRRDGDRYLDPVIVRGLVPRAVVDLDGDPAAEVIAYAVDEPPRYLLLGTGDAAVPPLPGEAPAVRPPPAGIDDPEVVAAWQHAEELAAIGLPARSAAELAAAARLSGHAREDMLMRAAELYTAAGAHAEAAERYIAAARRPDLADAALAGAVRSRRALADYAGAEALAAERAGLPDQDPAARAEAEAELAALRTATAPRPQLALRFDRPLDPRWRVHDPLAAAREPGGGLSLWTSSEDLLAELPLRWDGGAAALTVEAEVERLQWGDQLFVQVARPGGVDPWFGVSFRGEGSTNRPDQRFGPVHSGGYPHTRTLPDRLPVRVRLRFEVYPALGTLVITTEVAGEGIERVIMPAPEPPPAGPLRLVLLGRAPIPSLVGHVRVRAIDLRGFELGDPPPAGPLDPAARRIAEGELAPALALLSGAAGGPAVLWRADLLARLGRVDEAAAVLRGALQDVPEDSPAYAGFLARLHRRHDEFARAARQGLGPRYLDALFLPTLMLTEWEPDAIEGMLLDLADTPRAPLPGASPDERARQAQSLLHRAKAWQGFGHHALARDDAAAVLVLADDPRLTDAVREPLRGGSIRILLDAAVGLGDADAALRWSAAHLDRAPSREVSLELLRNNRGLAALLGEDDWAELARGPAVP